MLYRGAMLQQYLDPYEKENTKQRGKSVYAGLIRSVIYFIAGNK
jgi:hypothetical protein